LKCACCKKYKHKDKSGVFLFRPLPEVDFSSVFSHSEGASIVFNPQNLIITAYSEDDCPLFGTKLQELVGKTLPSVKMPREGKVMIEKLLHCIREEHKVTGCMMEIDEEDFMLLGFPITSPSGDVIAVYLCKKRFGEYLTASKVITTL
jgi:hypothetical protein